MKPASSTIWHDPHCCASRGCHNVCSHLCGTDLASNCCPHSADAPQEPTCAAIPPFAKEPCGKVAANSIHCGSVNANGCTHAFVPHVESSVLPSKAERRHE